MADVEIIDVTNGAGDVPAIGNTSLTDNGTVGKPKKADKQPGQTDSEKKFPVVPVVIGAVAAVVVVIVAIVAATSLSGGSAQGFGDVTTLSGLKNALSGEGENIQLDTNALKPVESVTVSSGAILRSGNGDVAEKGKQGNINYIYYINASDEMLQGQAGGTPYWQVYESSWEAGESLPVEITTDPIAQTSESDLAALTSASSTSSNSTMDELSLLLSGQKVGTVIAFLIPGSTSAQGSSPAQLILAELDSVSAVGETPDAPAAPEVSTDVPSNAPVIKFDDSGVPTGLTLDDSFQIDPDKILVKVISEGTGEVVDATDAVSAKYSGMLLSDGSIFDSSFKRGDEPTEFSLDSVIKGWKYGIAGQKVGSKLELIIPFQYAYGTKGSGQTIPGSSDLVFYVEVVSKKDAQTYAASQAASQASSQSSSQGSSSSAQQSVDPQTGLPAGYSLDSTGAVVDDSTGEVIMSASDYQEYLQQMMSGQQ